MSSEDLLSSSWHRSSFFKVLSILKNTINAYEESEQLRNTRTDFFKATEDKSRSVRQRNGTAWGSCLLSCMNIWNRIMWSTRSHMLIQTKLEVFVGRICVPQYMWCLWNCKCIISLLIAVWKFQLCLLGLYKRWGIYKDGKLKLSGHFFVETWS